MNTEVADKMADGSDKVRKWSRTVTDFEEFAENQVTRFGLNVMPIGQSDHFRASSTFSRFSFLNLVQFHVSPFQADCGPGLLSRPNHPELYVLQLPHMGPVRHRQDVRNEDVGAGEIALLDTRISGAMTIPITTRGCLLTVPVETWEAIAPAPHSGGSFVLRNHRLGTRIARTFAEEIVNSDADADIEHCAMIARQFIDLVSLTLADSMDRVPGRTHQLVRLRRIKTFIQSHLKDPRLGPKLIAYEFNLSVRSVSGLFRQADGSVMDYIWRSRLTRAAELLGATDRRYSVKEIWNLVGYRSASHFSSAFRNHHGMTPSEYREVMLRRSGTGPAPPG